MMFVRNPSFIPYWLYGLFPECITHTHTNIYIYIYNDGFLNTLHPLSWVFGGPLFFEQGFLIFEHSSPRADTHTNKHTYIYIYIMMDFWTLIVRFPGFLGGLCFLNGPLWYLNTHHPGQQRRHPSQLCLVVAHPGRIFEHSSPVLQGRGITWLPQGPLTHRHTHTQTHTNIYIHTYIIGGQIFERSMIFLNTHLPLCRGGGGVPHIPLMQNCPMIFLNTHHPPSGSGHLCDLHKASLASSGTTRAAHVLTKAAAGTSYRRRYIWQVKDTGRPVPALPPTLHQVSFICWIILHFIVDYFSDLGNYKLCWEMINEQKISINENYICIQLYFQFYYTLVWSIFPILVIINSVREGYSYA